ncbi:pirin family protein [Microbacterium sp. LRZ72]|uniref:pirin family protein n=1 Tax=Microbacterium sp. LRZ72 TaxID=2942481 RepID=UPI0029ADE142|nr:pirin family protein [Microbacterium sp. LRZ72]MDX2377481.1 pirin family protein [Microbacterium sp. LRZ72]
MTRVDAGPEEAEAPAACDGPRSLLLHSRDVPLGGVRGMGVHRALPQRDLPMVGAWCFLDRFGPQRTRMRVEPHPHIGLQTVTWPFVGEVRHRDAVGSDVRVARDALNLMTSGAGISHSEYSIGDEAVELDALQLWIALPDPARHGPPAFERHERLPVLTLSDAAGAATGEATVVMGELGAAASPATAFSPLVGAEVRIEPGASADVALRPDWEYAVLGVFGSLEPVGADFGADADSDSATAPVVGGYDLLYLGLGRDGIRLQAGPDGATAFLLGGEPFEEEIVMWWNFVGRSHDEIVAARDEWEASAPRFGSVVGHGDERIPAPPLPHVRLTPRRRRV